MSEEIKHYLQYDMHSAKVSWCPICNAHFYNERNREHTTEATSEHYHTIPKSEPVKPVYSDDFAWSVATLAIMAATKNTKAGKDTVIDIDAGIAAVKSFLNKLDSDSRPNSPVNPSLQSGVREAAKTHADEFYLKNSEEACGEFTENDLWENRYHNFIAGAEWQAQVKPVMQWVKASERLPKENKKVFWRMFKEKYTGHDNFNDGVNMDLEQIEWLEEPIQ